MIPDLIALYMLYFVSTFYYFCVLYIPSVSVSGDVHIFVFRRF